MDQFTFHVRVVPGASLVSRAKESGHDEARLIGRRVARVHSLELNMPRKKLARRFEPRYGVSQTMLDAECRCVGRELEDYLLLSMNDLRTKLPELQKQIATLDQSARPRAAGPAVYARP